MMKIIKILLLFFIQPVIGMEPSSVFSDNEIIMEEVQAAYEESKTIYLSGCYKNNHYSAYHLSCGTFFCVKNNSDECLDLNSAQKIFYQLLSLYNKQKTKKSN
jgi:hypothetical protein